MTRPFSQACENNKEFILEKLQDIVSPGDTVLEIGSGTAQHALHFAARLPELRWQPSELPANRAVLEAGLQDLAPDTVLAPVDMDVRGPWPSGPYDGIFSANCLHIMSADCVELFFAGVSERLVAGGYLCVYGPFNYDGRFTSDSNARFQQWLQDRDPASGIRDFEWVNALAQRAGFELVADHPMPANNRFLHWRLERR